MTKNKNTKLFLAGTMALSSVVAVGLPVAAADAPVVSTTEKVANKIANLSGNDKKIFNAVRQNVEESTSTFVKGNYVLAFSPLVDVLPSETSAIKAEVIKRINDFRSATELDGTSVITDEEFAYLGDFVNEVYDEVNQLDVTKAGALKTYLKNKYSAEADNSIVKKVFEDPSTPAVDSALDKIQRDAIAAIIGGGSGGGGIVTPPIDPETPTEPPTTTPGGGIETTPDTLKNNPEDVIEAINNADSITELAVEATPGEAVTIPLTVASALENKNADAVVVVTSTEASYELPVSVIDGAALAKELGVASSELNITVELTKIANQLPKEDSIGFAIEFSIKAVAPNGDSIDITYLGYPVQRSIETPTALNAATSVGVRVNADGTFTAVPTYIDGKTANLYFSANSAYTVIQNSKTFKDIDNRGYWAEEYIEKLASKMIVSGKSADSFSPSTSITRGEFAAVLARGLGLVAEDVSSADFSDVSPTQAVNRNGEIAAVVEAGIVSGYGNGKFGPYNEITRNEAAIMISNAMDYIGSEDIKMDTAKKVSDFADYRYISNSARPHVERVLQASYLSGFKDNTFRSQNETTRAETSRILYNFLNSIKFIN